MNRRNRAIVLVSALLISVLTVSSCDVATPYVPPPILNPDDVIPATPPPKPYEPGLLANPEGQPLNGGPPVIPVQQPNQANTTNATDKNANSTTESSPPDLTVKDVSFAPGSVNPGDKISVNFSVVNQGGTASGPFSNRISLATTTYGTDISLGNYDMASLGPNESRKQQPPLSINIPSTALPGTYYVTVYTDGFTKVNESDEQNNIGSAASLKLLSVTTVPPTTISSPNVTIESASGTVKTRQDSQYTYGDLALAASGKASGPMGSKLWIEVNLIDPVAGKFKLIGHQDATAEWSVTKQAVGPQYDSISIESKAGEPESMKWTYNLTSTSFRYTSDTTAVGQLVPGCELELLAIVFLPDGSQKTATSRFKAQ